MTTQQLGIIIASITAILAVFQALGIFIIQVILKNKIDFEFKKREQATIIASLFSEWIDKPTNPKELNRLTWEANLWLPDDLAKEINNRLANAPDAKDIREIIVRVKGLIHGKKSSINPINIVYFQKEEEKSV